MRAGSQGEDFREFVAWLQGDCVKGRELDVNASIRDGIVTQVELDGLLTE